jgi:general nucleoside transport system permease protein
VTTPPEAEPPSAGVTETPPAGTGQGQEKSQRKSFGTILKESFLEGNTFTVTVLALVTATVIGGILCAFTNATVLNAPTAGATIARAWDVASGTYVALFEGSVFNPHTVAALFQQASLSTAIHDGYLSGVFQPLSETAVSATPLILTGLAVALPYRAGLFNIGGQGQFIGGAILATWLGYAISLPFFVHVVVCVIGGFVGGAVIGWLTGEIKARTGAHEVIVTIMLNYVMQYFLAYLLSSQSLLQASGSPNPITPPIASNAHLPLLFGGNLRINAGFLIALACAFGVWWLLNRTTTGFEFRSVGANSSAARVAGMNVERSWVLVMLIGGGLAGLAGATVIQGTDFTLNPQSYGTYGIDAITVALLGLGRPGGVVAAGLLFGALHAGSPGMQTVTSTPVQIVQVLQALIVLFVAAPPLIRAIYRLHAARASGVGSAMSKGWNA